MEKINRKQFRSPLTPDEREFIDLHYNVDMTAKEIATKLAHPIRLITNYYHVSSRRKPVVHEEFLEPHIDNIKMVQNYLRMPWRPLCTLETSDCA